MKRAAVAEVQKAMALAEKRALDSVAEERVKMERILMETNNNNNNNNANANAISNKYISENAGHVEITSNRDKVCAKCWDHKNLPGKYLYVPIRTYTYR